MQAKGQRELHWQKLIKQNMVLKIRNGMYTCVSGENGGPVANRYQVASAIHASSYISHHSTFEYYGITDQVFYDVYVSSEMRFHDFVSAYSGEWNLVYPGAIKNLKNGVSEDAAI